MVGGGRGGTKRGGAGGPAGLARRERGEGCAGPPGRTCAGSSVRDPDYHFPAVPLAEQAVDGVQSRLTVEPLVALRSLLYVYTLPDLLVAVRM